MTRTYKSVAQGMVYNTVGAMGSSNLTLNGTVVGTVNFVLGLFNDTLCNTAYLVDEEDTLTQVELSILHGIDSFNLNKMLVGVLKNLGSTMYKSGNKGIPTFCNP